MGCARSHVPRRPADAALRAVNDFEVSGLLDGLSDKERSARKQLLEQLADDGFTLDELKRAVQEDRLALLPVERVLGARYSAEEIERRTGVSARLMLRIRRLLGLPEAQPDDRVFGDEDIEAARSAQLFLDAGVTEDGLAEITRVLGESMRRLAVTVGGSLADTFLKPGDTEAELGQRFAELGAQLTPAMTPVLIAAFTAHLRDMINRAVIGTAEREAGQIAGAQELTVCFADLVGFTRLGGEVEVHELGSVAGRLADMAGELTREPVRLLKTIGDAALFVSPDPAPMVEVALAFVDAVQDAELPSLRAGLALGPTQVRAGDVYGHSVNLASRVTGIARPGSVLCTEEVREATEDRFNWSFAGRHKLKGVQDRVPLHRARWNGGQAEGEQSKRKSAASKDRRAKK
jgi:adenylate cyclase